MRTDEIDLVMFGPEHIDGAVSLSQQAQWPHRREDWQMMLALSDGTVVLDANGRVVGTILLTRFGQDCAAINMVIVDEAMRGHGLGRKLMERAFAFAGGRPLRLVATAEGLPLYRKLGFAECGTIRQHQGEVRLVAASRGVVLATGEEIAAIKRLDRDAFGADRSALIDRLASAGKFAVIRRDGVVTGYAALRAFGRGEVIGPIVATSADEAKALIAFFAASRTGAFLRIDTDSDSGLADWLEKIGLQYVGGGIAMSNYAPKKPDHARVRTFALASQALG
jgi:predicted N-acetyltransferase YhbS